MFYMPTVCIPVSKQHIAKSQVDDIVLSKSFEQLLSFYIIPTDREEYKRIAEHGNIPIYCFSCNVLLLPGLDVALIGECISDAVRRSDAADV